MPLGQPCDERTILLEIFHKEARCSEITGAWLVTRNPLGHESETLVSCRKHEYSSMLSSPVVLQKTSPLCVVLRDFDVAAVLAHVSAA